MRYEMGQTYDFCGEQRRVIGFDGAGLPVTTKDLSAPMQFTAEASMAALRERLEADFAVRLQTEKEAAVLQLHGLLALLPLDKCTLEQLRALLLHLGREVAEKAEKADLIAALMA